MLFHGGNKRWSYICADPVRIIHSQEGLGEPLERMERETPDVDYERTEDTPPFCGGWAGLFSFEFGRAVLPRLEEGPPRGNWPDVALGLYDQVAVFDHENQIGEVWSWDWGRGVQRGLIEKLGKVAPDDWRGPLCQAPPAPIETLEGYADKIAKTVAYVHAGDCFQSNISQPFHFMLQDGAHPFDLTIRLDRSSKAPFSAYFRLEGLALASNSPERFLNVRALDDGELEVSTKPIKGTRPRGATPEEDKRLSDELEASEKDRAENLMIVDLMRNDLSRVCVPGTVKVPKLNALESYANVHHLVSTVEARLMPGRGPTDLIRAAFPGGSVTGAPKIRAMQIIAEMEGRARGPYCGSLVWIAPDGQMDSSILIRSTAFEEQANGWFGEFRVGGGIVADSKPHEEYQETIDKGAALVGALTADGPSELEVK